MGFLTWLRTQLPSGGHRQRRRSCRPPAPHFRPTLELLEDRLCPAAPGYYLTDLGTLGLSTGLTNINASGQVAGSSFMGVDPATGGQLYHAGLWTPSTPNGPSGSWIDLGTFGGPSSGPTDINNSGQVAGFADTATGLYHAFLWTPVTPNGTSGSMIDLGTLGGNSSTVSALNNAGQVVGGADTPTGSSPFVWENGVLYDLNNLIPANSGWVLTVASDINNNGQIVGSGIHNGQSSAFLLTDPNGVFADGGARLTDLGALGPTAINDAGQVVGGYLAPKGYTHAFVWQTGKLKDLGTLAQGQYSLAQDINNAGQVVGTSTINTAPSYSQAFQFHPFLWQNGMSDLNDLIPAGSGWTLSSGSQTSASIGDAGQIVGYPGYQGSGSFLLTPGAATVPALSINDASVTEGNAGTTNMVFTVTLSASSSQTVTVAYATYQDSATAGLDYTSVSGTLTFAPGETSKTVSVPVIGDRLPEWNETFAVVLSNPTNARLLDSVGAGTILDDEPRFTINDVSGLEGNTGTTSFVFTVSLSLAYDQVVTVNYATADGTATTADNDYVGATGTLTFAPGETSKTLTVTVNGDRLPEPNETFFVNLSASPNALVVKGQGVGTILDDEPRLTISDVTHKEGNSGTTLFVFTVTLSIAYDVPVTVNYATADGTATVADNDYQAASGTLTFAPGQTTQTITIRVIGDTKKEADETFFVNLSGATNALILDGQGLGTILNDDH